MVWYGGAVGRAGGGGRGRGRGAKKVVKVVGYGVRGFAAGDGNDAAGSTSSGNESPVSPWSSSSSSSSAPTAPPPPNNSSASSSSDAAAGAAAAAAAGAATGAAAAGACAIAAGAAAAVPAPASGFEPPQPMVKENVCCVFLSGAYGNDGVCRCLCLLANLKTTTVCTYVSPSYQRRLSVGKARG